MAYLLKWAAFLLLCLCFHAHALDAGLSRSKRDDSGSGTNYSSYTITNATITETLQLALDAGLLLLDLDTQHNHYYYETGLDTDDVDVYSHQLDMFASPSPISEDCNKCAFLELLLIQEIQKITQENVETLLENSLWQDALKTFLSEYCKTTPLPECDAHARYRSIGGTCNNLKYPRRGMALRAQRRYRHPTYEDGIESPRSKSVLGGNLPSPRVVSNGVFKSGKNRVFSRSHTVLHMAWGQFLDHDLIFTPVIKGENETDINCCVGGKRPECLPIEVPDDDPHIKENCMNFVRSSAAVDDTLKGYRDQMNEVTSYHDASNVYGSTPEKMQSLRAYSRGLMTVDEYNRMPVGQTDCFKDQPDDYCQGAGDKRVNVVPNLSSLHLLWVREHNRIAERLAAINWKWSDETLFYETRKIIIGRMQHITYNEYLPAILSEAYMKAFQLSPLTSGYCSGYDQEKDATIANVFGAAAFRMGHSQVPNVQAHYSPHGMAFKTVPLETTFHRPHLCQENKGKGYEGVLRWLITSNALKVDRFFANGLRNKLFTDKEGRSMDLTALNINRARDHGVPAYNVWRQWCNLPRAETFDVTTGGLIHHAADAAAALRHVYGHPDDIDLYPGAISENFISGGHVGPTFACILGFQFQNLKYGDRFWYENSGNSSLTTAQLAEVRKTSLSKVICNNIEVKRIQPLAFQPACSKRGLLQCTSLPDIDLRYWKDAGDGY